MAPLATQLYSLHADFISILVHSQPATYLPKACGTVLSYQLCSPTQSTAYHYFNTQVIFMRLQLPILLCGYVAKPQIFYYAYLICDNWQWSYCICVYLPVICYVYLLSHFFSVSILVVYYACGQSTMYVCFELSMLIIACYVCQLL